MIHAISEKTAKLFCVNGWIDSDQIDWCIYSAEKTISWCFSCAMIAIYVAISKKAIEAISFGGAFCMLRRHLGGYHTKHHWSCQVLSVGVVIAICGLIGPVFEKLDFLFLLLIDGCALIILFFINPSFPAQLHLTAKEKAFHKYQAKKLVVACAVIQYLAEPISKTCYVYTILGLISVIISVIISSERSF